MTLRCRRRADGEVRINGRQLRAHDLVQLGDQLVDLLLLPFGNIDGRSSFTWNGVALVASLDPAQTRAEVLKPEKHTVKDLDRIAPAGVDFQSGMAAFQTADHDFKRGEARRTVSELTDQLPVVSLPPAQPT